MEPTLSELYREHVDVHYPELFRYTVLIAHENEDTGSESIGSGVLVSWGEHHLVATAAHCMRRNPRVIREHGFRQGNDEKIVTVPRVPIIQRWTHPRLDVGFLEIDEALGAEMTEDQLFSGQVVSGALHIVGYPEVRIETDERLRVKTLVKSVFSSEIIEQSDDRIRLAYPEDGYLVEDNQWVKRPFIERPHGFSGGGLFGITSDSGELRVIGYKLIGIQSAWSSVKRWVTVIPIRHWLDGTRSQFAS